MKRPSKGHKSQAGNNPWLKYVGTTSVIGLGLAGIGLWLEGRHTVIADIATPPPTIPKLPGGLREQVASLQAPPEIRHFANIPLSPKNFRA